MKISPLAWRCIRLSDLLPRTMHHDHVRDASCEICLVLESLQRIFRQVILVNEYCENRQPASNGVASFTVARDLAESGIYAPS